MEQELTSFLETSLKEEIEDVIFHTEQELHQFAMENTLKDFQNLYQGMLNDINNTLYQEGRINPNLILNQEALFITFATFTALSSLAMVFTSISPLLVALLPMIVAIVAVVITVVITVIKKKGTRDTIRERVQNKLSLELRKSLEQITVQLQDEFLKRKPVLVEKLREVAQAPALEIQAQLQQQQDNLNQLLIEKHSEEFNIENKRQELIR